MSSPSEVLAPRVTAAIAAAFGAEYPELRDADPVLRPSQFADLQVNAPLALAKKVRMPPREVAAQILAHLDLDGIAEPVEISGPGFLNITLTNDWLATAVAEMAADPRLGVPRQLAENIRVPEGAPGRL